MNDTETWEQRYQTEDMPWEKGAPSPGLVDFLAERGFTRVPWWRLLTGVEGIKLISPLVEKPPMHTQFL